MLPAIDWILDLLEDGKWHNLSEILEESQLPSSKMKTIVGFLSEYELINVDKESKKVRLTPQMFDFLKNIREAEKGLKSLHQKEC